MLYAVYVHPGDETHAHGVTLPDFPGCFSAADRWEDIPAKIQEAVELYFAGESLEVPVPTPLDRLRDDPQYTDGEWILLDIDLTRLHPRTRRIDVTLPESLLDRIDAYARARRTSRSGFISEAITKAMEEKS